MPEPARHQPARILDANANRAREALRVLEDAARFLLDDPAASRAFKTLRHDLVEILSELPAGVLEANRATGSDVGRSISLESERERPDALSVVRAAGGRLGESLRSLEEWSKTIDPALSGRFEAVRYRGYEATAALVERLASPAPQWRLCAVITRSGCALPPAELVRRVVEAGADCIQVREKTLGDAELSAWVAEVIEIARPAGTSVVVNDRADIALVTGADGVHLGAGDLSIGEVRRLAGRTLWIGATAHDEFEVRNALAAGCDSLGLGTMYASPTKPECGPSGPAFLEAFLSEHPGVPHLAIGGIDACRAAELAALGCGGVALSSAICGSEDPGQVVRDVLGALQGREPVRG
jgi:thiamine-phosphate pyrophosphorylase